MREVESQLQQIEISLEEAQHQVALAEALQRLHDNADFKLVILKGYFEQECQRTVMLKFAANYIGEQNQKDAENVLTGIGMLGQYFRKIFIRGEQADRAIQADSATREELLEEQLRSDEDLVN